MSQYLRRECDLPAVAEMIQAVHVPSIAEWRWGTLHKATITIAEVLPTLIAHFEACFFKFANAADPVKMKKCAQALACPVWRWRFDFVLWYCDWVCSLQSWGQGCECHSPGDSTQCRWKGRRLPQAAAVVGERLQMGLDEASSWNLHRFAGQLGRQDDLLELQLCVRTSVHLANLRFDYLQKIPWLLSRILEPGIREQCLDQWDSCSPDGHHRTSVRFLSPGSPLRRAIDELSPHV